jgi:hypothetical protein
MDIVNNLWCLKGESIMLEEQVKYLSFLAVLSSTSGEQDDIIKRALEVISNSGFLVSVLSIYKAFIIHTHIGVIFRVTL